MQPDVIFMMIMTSQFRSAEKHLSGGSTAASEQQGTLREETSQPTMK